MMPSAAKPLPAYCPPSRVPAQVMLCNLVCSRKAPWRFLLGETPCELHPAPLGIPFTPICRLFFSLGKAIWVAEVGSADILRFHPALTGVEDLYAMPRPVREAVLETLLAPLMTSFTPHVGTELALTEVVFPDADEPLAPLKAPQEESGMNCICRTAELASFAVVPVRVCPPNLSAVRELAPVLAVLPSRDKESFSSALGVPVTASVVAGKMVLSAKEVRCLEVGDTLLPEQYLAAQGRVTLTFSLASGTWNATATVCEQRASLTAFFTTRTKETTMPDVPAPPIHDEHEPQAGQQEAGLDESGTSTPEGLDPGALEMNVCFELERRTLELRDVMSLSPGYTFMLD
ncbi:MAG: hypothetical protein RR014_01010, partial [Bilophila sp.]